MKRPGRGGGVGRRPAFAQGGQGVGNLLDFEPLGVDLIDPWVA
jgi:hypothetical protein